MNIIEDFITAFFEQPPRIFIVMGLVIFGWIVKRADGVINSKWIPVILPLLGIVAFPAMMASDVHQIGRLGVEGFVGGCLAVWIHQVHKQLFASKSINASLFARLLGGMNEKETNADQDVQTQNGVPPGHGIPGGDDSRPGNAPPDSGVH